MTMRVISCGACGADVPHGRLSCPACGELLASVSGAIRVASAAIAPSPGGRPSVVAPDDRPLVDALLDDDPEPLLASTAAVAPAMPRLDDPEPEPEPEAVPEPDVPADDPDQDIQLAFAEAPSEPALDPYPDTDAEPQPAWPPSGTATPSWPDYGREAPSWPDPVPVLPIAAATPPPGAYLPPTAVPSPTPPSILGTAAVAAMPAGPAAPARAWAGPARDGVERSGGEEDAGGAAARAGVDEAIGWVAVGACTISLLGFLIPWARTVIGSAGAGYLDQWGLAGPGHPVIVLALGLILAGAMIPNRIPAWLRLGVPGLVVGAILIGLVWPYVLGPLGALPGAFLSLAGAVTLVVASIASIVVDRHAARRPAV